MSQLRAVNIQEILARAGEALSKASEDTVVLSEVEVLSNDHRRNFIARAAARYTDGGARSVIVKATRSPSYNPTDENVLQASGLAREWVACAFLAVCAPGRGHGSALLAGDVAGGIMVFEDLGAHPTSLVDPLLKGTAQEAERALKLYAKALGRLRADTVGCLDAHHKMLQSVFGSGRPRHPPEWRLEKDAELVADRLGGAPPASELELLSSRLSDPGPWLTLTHGDPCPDNSLLVGHCISPRRLRVRATVTCAARRHLLENGISDMLVRRTHPGRCHRPRGCGLSGRAQHCDPPGRRGHYLSHRAHLYGGGLASDLFVVAIGPGARVRREMGHLVDPRAVALVCGSGHRDDGCRSSLARCQQGGQGLAVGAAATLARCKSAWPIPLLRKQVAMTSAEDQARRDANVGFRTTPAGRRGADGRSVPQSEVDRQCNCVLATSRNRMSS